MAATLTELIEQVRSLARIDSNEEKQPRTPFSSCFWNQSGNISRCVADVMPTTAFPTSSRTYTGNKHLYTMESSCLPTAAWIKLSRNRALSYLFKVVREFHSLHAVISRLGSCHEARLQRRSVSNSLAWRTGSPSPQWPVVGCVAEAIK